MSGVVIEKVDGVWVFPLAGFVCAAVRSRVGTDFDLVLHPEDFTAAARIGLAGEHRDFVDSLVEDRTRVERVGATGDSTLLAEFEGGKTREVPAGEYEEWEVEGAGFFAVSPAGGGEPAIWDSTSKTWRVHRAR